MDFSNQEDLRCYARACNDNDDGQIPFDEIHWDYDSGFPVSRLLEIMSLEMWRKFMTEELEIARVDLGDELRWACLLEEEIEEPVVILEREDGTLSIWDGWHRSAASVVKGAETIKAVFGSSRDHKFERFHIF